MNSIVKSTDRFFHSVEKSLLILLLKIATVGCYLNRNTTLVIVMELKILHKVDKSQVNVFSKIY